MELAYCLSDIIGLRLFFGPFHLALQRPARLKRSLEAHGLLVLLEKVGERLVGELLKALAGSTGKSLNRLKGLIVELNAPAGHAST